MVSERISNISSLDKKKNLREKEGGIEDQEEGRREVKDHGCLTQPPNLGKKSRFFSR